MDKLENCVQYLKGVGPKKAKLLNKIGIKTIEDLMYYFPRSYEDRRNLKKISILENGERANLRVIICGAPRKYRPRRNMSIIKIPAKDETGIIYLTWFNQDYIIKNVNIGDIISINGRVKKFGSQIEMQNPVYEKCDETGKKTGRIIPIYQLTEKLSNNDLTKIIEQALANYLDYTVDVIPKSIIDELGLLPFRESIKNIHFPKDRISYKKAKDRLVFEELLLLQLGLLIMKKKEY